MERYEVNKTLESLKTSLSYIEKALDIDALTSRLLLYNEAMLAPDFWNNQTNAKQVSQQATLTENKLNRYQRLINELLELELLVAEITEVMEDWSSIIELVNQLKTEISDFEIAVLLNGEFDSLNAILEIHPGAGGTESQDWGQMLYRMYLRYAANKNFKVEVLDYQPADEAGIKSVTILIKGDYAYGYLKAERGVHRLVRISPFDSNARRHTSFASVDVVPEFDDNINIEIKSEDIKVDVYRSGGAGGQSVNTTDSAVRITHLATGIVVTCQAERSQIKNKEAALKILKAKLFQLELQQKAQALSNIKGEQKDIAWGSQIRSYVFQPYQLVKDHRSGHEIGNVAAVMDGGIDEFINAYLKGVNHE